jgi:hypothetical protein
MAKVLFRRKVLSIPSTARPREQYFVIPLARLELMLGNLIVFFVLGNDPCKSGCLCDTGVAKNVPDIWPNATGVLCGVRGMQHMQQRLSKVPVLQSRFR